MQVILDIPDNEVSVFRELIQRFHYTAILNEQTLTAEQTIFVQDLKDAMLDVELHQAGKKKLKTAKELWNEL